MDFFGLPKLPVAAVRFPPGCGPSSRPSSPSTTHRKRKATKERKVVISLNMNKFKKAVAEEIMTCDSIPLMSKIRLERLLRNILRAAKSDPSKENTNYPSHETLLSSLNSDYKPEDEESDDGIVVKRVRTARDIMTGRDQIPFISYSARRRLASRLMCVIKEEFPKLHVDEKVHYAEDILRELGVSNDRIGSFDIVDPTLDPYA